MKPRAAACTPCQFIPPYLLGRLAQGEPPARTVAERTLAVDERLRSARAAARPRPGGAGAAGAPAWTIHDAQGTEKFPGAEVRRPGQAATGDAAVDEAADGVAATLAMYAEVYRRRSYDDAGAEVVATVHYGQQYANAFWNGDQLVIGDGDGVLFGRFTAAIDVLAHELTHAVTENTAALAYRDQSGALNESVSDVFAACLDQRLKGQTPEEADWLIGAEVLLPGVDGVALRSMKAPGTAYDDPRLGKDPQPAHFRDYVRTSDDNGGVHINSGIPNRAFYLAAVGIGGSSWDGAGRVWYDALTGSDVGPNTDFAGFAAATVAAAGPHADTVREAWAGVGVEPGATGGGGAGGGAGGGRGGRPDRVRVRRTGGFAAIPVEGVVDLGDDTRSAELAALVSSAGLDDPAAGPAASAVASQPDRFVYEFEVDGVRRTVGEPELTDDLRRVVDVVLQRPDPA